MTANLPIRIQSLQVNHLYVSKRSSGWVVELFPGTVLDRNNNYILEPKNPTEEEKTTYLFESMEDAVQQALNESSPDENKKKIKRIRNTPVNGEVEEEEEFEEPSDPDSDATKMLESLSQGDCEVCKASGDIVAIQLGIELPITGFPSFGDEEISGVTRLRVPYIGICRKCLLEFLDEFKDYVVKDGFGVETIDSLIETLKDDSVLDSNDPENVERIRRVVAAFGRILYPLLIWSHRSRSEEEYTDDEEDD